MQPIKFVGIRGGYGTTTVTFAAATTLATRGPTRIATRDRRALCAIVGIAHDGLPIPLAEHLDLTPDEFDGDVVDAGTLERYLDEGPFEDELAECRQSPSAALRIGVLRRGDPTPSACARCASTPKRSWTAWSSWPRRAGPSTHETSST